MDFPRCRGFRARSYLNYPAKAMRQWVRLRICAPGQAAESTKGKLRPDLWHVRSSYATVQVQATPLS